MAETRRKFDQDFREGAVRLVRETGKPIAQVARAAARAKVAAWIEDHNTKRRHSACQMKPPAA